MKKIFFFGLLLLSSLSYAQSVDVKWSLPVAEKKKQVGYSDFVEGEGKYLYTYCVMGRTGYTQNETMLVSSTVYYANDGVVAYDRESLKEVAVMDFSDEKSSLKKLPQFKDYSLLAAFPTNDKVVVFLRKSERSGEETIAVADFTPELKPNGNPRIVHEVKTPRVKIVTATRVFRNKSTGSFVLVNETQGEQGNIVLRYKSLDADYVLGESGDVNLPFVWDGGFNAKKRDFQLTADNYLILNADAKEENPNAPRRKRWMYFRVFTIISMNDGSYGNYTLKSDERKYSGIDIETKNGKASLLGFYSNTNEEGENPVLNGFFSSTLDLASGEFQNTVTTDFDDDFYVNFKNHYPDKVKGSAKDNPYHYVNGMRIEKRVINGDKTILICHVQNNEKIKYSSGNELIHCVNRGVVTFVLNGAMKMEKYHILPRVSRYDFLHNVDDMEVAVQPDGSCLIVFSANADLKEVNKEGKPEKKEEKLVDTEVHYAIMNSQGELEGGKFVCNASTLKTDQKCMLYPEQFKENGGKMYIFGSYGAGAPNLQMAVGRISLK